MYKIEQWMENVWVIEQGFVRSYLFTGPDRAILVDSCLSGDLLSVCRSVTDRPIVLLTTHADPDHTGCDQQFAEQYLHPAEYDRYARRMHPSTDLAPMWDGDIFTAGDFALEVVLIPGHTPGSVALLDRKHRLLISGDTVQNGCVYLFGEGRDLSAFHASLRKMERLRREGAFETVLASHGDVGISAQILDDQLALVQQLERGTAEEAGLVPEGFPKDVCRYQYGSASAYVQRL